MHTFLKLASILLALAVVIGAFGAHGLESKISAERLATFETGVKYHFYHGFALLVVALLLKDYPIGAFRVAGWCFFAGVLLFSGSIYLLATRDLIGITSTSLLGPITPIGGTFFIAGWVAILIGAFRV